MVLISGVFYKHLTNDVDVVVGRPPCQGLTKKMDNNVITILENHSL